MARPLEDPPVESSVWESTSGVAAHPNAPVGGGGPGRFNQNTPAGADGNNSNPIAHPQGPATRFQTFEAGEIKELRKAGLDVEDATPLQSGPPTKAPPTTKPSKSKITRKNAKEDIDVEVEVIADGALSGAGREWDAETKCNPKGLDISFSGASISDKNIITKPGVMTIKGTITIQVLYGTLAKSTSPAGWGRGTTKADRTSGDTTVGFHESKHMEDFLAYLKATPFPSFGGAAGQTEDAYNAIVNAYTLDPYFADMKTKSKATTDNPTDADPTLDNYIKKHPNTVH